MTSDIKETTSSSFAEQTTTSNIHAEHCIVTLYCHEHTKSELAIFCETCGEAICLKCIKKREKHNDHDWEELDEAIERYKSEEIPVSLQTVEEALTELNACRDELSNQRAAIEDEIHETEILDLEKTKLIGHLHELTQVKVKGISAKKDEFETTKLRLDKYMTLLGGDKEMQRKITSLGSVKKILAELQPDMLELTTIANMVFLPSLGAYGQIAAMSLPDPSKCYATGNGLEKAIAGKKSTATVQIVNLKNLKIEKESEIFITCELISEATDSKLKGIVEMREQSQYYISYIPTIDGHHQLHIKVKGQHINGSPFCVDVEDPIQPMKRPRGVVLTTRHERKATMVSGWRIPQSLVVPTRDVELGPILGEGKFIKQSI